MIDSVSRSLVPELNAPAAAPAPAAPENAFKGTLWEAFAGHAGPVGPTTVTPPAPAAAPPSSPAADLYKAPPADNKPAAGTNLPSLSRPSTPMPTVSPAAGPRKDAGASANDPVRAVSEAMTRVGLDPAKYNLRTGSLPITVPNGGSYEYPVLFADVGGETLGFWLPSALSSPGMIAANIGNMIGNPIYEIV